MRSGILSLLFFLQLLFLSAARTGVEGGGKKKEREGKASISTHFSFKPHLIPSAGSGIDRGQREGEKEKERKPCGAQAWNRSIGCLQDPGLCAGEKGEEGEKNLSRIHLRLISALSFPGDVRLTISRSEGG